MVVKKSKLRPRQKKYSSSDNESPIVFSESSDESLPLLEPQIQVKHKSESPKHLSHGVFKSPVKCVSPKLEVNKKKIVRTYGTKLIFWESVASSTPLHERPAKLKLTPFSPINSIPSPSESPFEEQGQENSNDWCTVMIEEQKIYDKRQSSLTTKNRTLTAAGNNTLPGRNLSSEAVENGPSRKAVKEGVPERHDSRNNGSGKKQPSVNNKSDEVLVSNDSRPQHVKNTTAPKDGRVSISQADSETHKKKATTENGKVNSKSINMERTIYGKRITRQSKIPAELIAQSIVVSESEDVGNVKEKEVAGREEINHPSCKISPRKSVRFVEEGQLKEDVNLGEAEITTEKVEKNQRSPKQLRQTVSASVNAVLETSQQHEKDEDNLDSSPSKNTRNGGKRKQKAVVTDRIQQKQDAGSESAAAAAVRVASEKPEDTEANLVSASPLKKMKVIVNLSKEIINNSKKITVKKKHSIKKLHTEEVDSSLRKSKRQRLAPVQYWKGERVQYKPVNHPECKIMYKIVGVVRPRVQERTQENGRNAPRDKLKKREKHMKQTHPKKIVQYEDDILSFSKSCSTPTDVREKIPLKLYNVTQDVECVAHFSKTAFEPFVPYSGHSVDGVQYQPCLSVNGLTNGILKIAAGTSLQNEINDDTDMLLFVARGIVDIIVNGHTAHMRPGSSIIIPRGFLYTIKNNSSSGTLLSCVKKM